MHLESTGLFWNSVPQSQAGRVHAYVTPLWEVVTTPHSQMTTKYHQAHSPIVTRVCLCQTEALRKRRSHSGMCCAVHTVTEKLMLRPQLHLALKLRLPLPLGFCHEPLPGPLASRLTSSASLYIAAIPYSQDFILIFPPSLSCGERSPSLRVQPSTQTLQCGSCACPSTLRCLPPVPPTGRLSVIL